MNIKWTFAAVLLGFLMDLCIGDPRWLYHPVRIIGNGIQFFEKKIRSILPKTMKGERIGGFVLVIIILVVSTCIPFVILWTAYNYAFWVGFLIETIFCYQILATKALKDESMKVYDALKQKDIIKARYAVSMIVGRDTKELDEVGVTKATVETIAENTSDGIVAPLFYMLLGGACMGFAYKAVNTMDSMIGYKNEKYQYFGTVAAKLDDFVNFVPARLSGFMMILGAFICKCNGKEAMRIFLRDRFNHSSPNSAQTEAVMAGALEVQLAGDAYYFGTLYKKKTIGDPIRPIEILDIVRANQLLYVTATLSILIFGGIRFLILIGLHIILL